MKYLKLISLACVSLLALPGCDTVFFGGVSAAAHQLNIFQNPDVNLRAKNYAAADYIIQQAKTFIQSGETIQIHPLVNFDDPKTPAQIGNVMAEEMGARLTQLGYDVDLALVNAHNPAITVKTKPLANPDFILSGNYTNKRPVMDVSLRITEMKSGRTVGAFDYTMNTNREVRKLATPAPQIMIKQK